MESQLLLFYIRQEHPRGLEQTWHCAALGSWWAKCGPQLSMRQLVIMNY